MTEERNAEELENTTQGSEESTDTAQEQSEKLFTQFELDRIIKDRVAREKVNTSKVKTDFEAYKANTEDALAKYEESTKLQVEALSADIPENLKSILGKLTITEQLEWLTNPDNNHEPRKSPLTPKPVRQETVTEVEKVRRIF